MLSCFVFGLQSIMCLEQGTGALQAFTEWSKQAFSFTSEQEIENAFLNCAARTGEDDLPFLDLKYFQKLISQHPAIVYHSGKNIRLENTSDDLGNSLEFASFFNSINIKKSSWRNIVRTSRIIWPNAKREVVEQISAFMDEFPADHAANEEEINRVWDRASCQCKYYIDCVIANVKRQLCWPKLITKIIPRLMSRSLNEYADVFSFECDEIDSLVFKLQTKSHQDVQQTVEKTYKLNLKTGMINGTKIGLCEAAFMFNNEHHRNPLELKPEFSLEAQVNWAKRLCKIPQIRDNLRCVARGMFFFC